MSGWLWSNFDANAAKPSSTMLSAAVTSAFSDNKMQVSSKEKKIVILIGRKTLVFMQYWC